MRRHLTATILLGAALAAGAPTAATAANLFAAPAAGATSCAQSDPCSLATALGAAAAWDTVWLAGGTYTGTGAEVAVIATGLTLRGGWDGTTAAPPVVDPAAHPTLLDGQGARRVVDVTAGAGASVVLEDLEVRNGFHALRGAGISCAGADLTLRRCTVASCAASSGNTNDTSGGGLDMTGGNLRVEETWFWHNYADCTGCSATLGGAISLYGGVSAVLADTEFTANDAWDGAAVFFDGAPGELTVERTGFTQNGLRLSGSDVRGGYGGGLMVFDAALTLLDSTFDGNDASNEGGALYFNGSAARIERNVFVDNTGLASAAVKTASTAGTRVVNNLFHGNAATNAGGVAGIDVAAGPAEILHTTILGTGAADAGAGIRTQAGSGTVTVRNTILARLDPGVLLLAGSTAATGDGILWGGGGWANTADVLDNAGAWTAGPVAVTGDPGFLEDSLQNLPFLAATSAARNAGVPAGVATDIDGAPRAGAPDIGASEYQPAVVMANPRRRQVLRAGSPFPLRYRGPGRAAEYRLRYSLDGGARWRTVTDIASPFGYEWRVPAPPGNRRSCLVKATAVDLGGKVVGSDRNPGPFEIRVVQVDAPAAQASWQGGTTQAVAWSTWATVRPVAAVQLFFSTDGGRHWRKIPPAVPEWNPGRQEWTPPVYARARTNCRVKVVLRDAAGKVVGSARSGRFTIAKP